MAGYYKKWLMEQREKALDDPDFPDFMSREEMFRDLDKEYEEYCEKNKILNEGMYAEQLNCDSMTTGNLCKDPNCLQCKEYIESKNINQQPVKTEENE